MAKEEVEGKISNNVETKPCVAVQKSIWFQISIEKRKKTVFLTLVCLLIKH